MDWDKSPLIKASKMHGYFQTLFYLFHLFFICFYLFDLFLSVLSVF